MKGVKKVIKSPKIIDINIYIKRYTNMTQWFGSCYGSTVSTVMVLRQQFNTKEQGLKF
jgi:hypothetical protein